MNPWISLLRSTLLLPLFFIVLLVPAAAQEKSVVPGINKPYENPDVKGFVKYFEGESREVFTHRKEIVAACPLRPGMAVADVGAGTGLFTRLIAAAVGPQGKVYAVDIAPKFVEHIKDTCRQAGLTNVECVVCTQTSVELPAGSIDLAFLSDASTIILSSRRNRCAHPPGPPQGRAACDRRLPAGPGQVGRMDLKHVRAGQEVVTKEIEAAGFRRVGEEFPFLKENYGIRFERGRVARGQPARRSRRLRKMAARARPACGLLPHRRLAARSPQRTKYQAIGINLYVGLWEGPTAEADRRAEAAPHAGHLRAERVRPEASRREDHRRLDARRRAGQRPVAGPRARATARRSRRRRSSRTTAGSRPRTPRRPVMLNLGQGVAWDGWYGRGVRTNHPEDYAQYVRGGDIVSFDIYPAVHDKPAVAGKLWYVPRGVERLRGWAGGDRIVWNCIECTRIGNTKTKPTPQQVKAEVWMSIIHGSQGHHLLLPPVPAPVHRGGPAGRRGDGPGRGGDQPRGPEPGRGHQQPFASQGRHA